MEVILLIRFATIRHRELVVYSQKQACIRTQVLMHACFGGVCLPFLSPEFPLSRVQRKRSHTLFKKLSVRAEVCAVCCRGFPVGDFLSGSLLAAEHVVVHIDGLSSYCYNYCQYNHHRYHNLFTFCEGSIPRYFICYPLFYDAKIRLFAHTGKSFPLFCSFSAFSLSYIKNAGVERGRI